MSTATTYQPRFASRIVPARSRRMAGNKAFCGCRSTFAGKAHCIKDRVLLDPCMGSGHILVYAFDVLMQIYEAAGYSQRDTAKSILENNIYGLDIDDKAYQMAYFAVMTKARQYNRRILSAETACHVYSIQDNNNINRNQITYFGVGLNEVKKNDALNQIGGLLVTFEDVKEYGSILNIENYDWELLRRFVESADVNGQVTLGTRGLEQTEERLLTLIDIGEVMAVLRGAC